MRKPSHFSIRPQKLSPTIRLQINNIHFPMIQEHFLLLYLESMSHEKRTVPTSEIYSPFICFFHCHFPDHTCRKVNPPVSTG